MRSASSTILDQRPIENRAFDEAAARIAQRRRRDCPDCPQGQRIEHHDALDTGIEQMGNEIGANELQRHR